MTTYFLDASAVVKRYLAEIGSDYILTIVDPSVPHTIILAEITRVEVAAAIAAVARGAAIVRVHDVAATRDALAVWCVAAKPNIQG